MKRAGLGVVLIVLGACGPQAGGDWIRPQYAEHLRFVRDAGTDALDIWRSGGDALRLSNTDAAVVMETQLRGHKLVMVSLRPDSELAELLQHDARTLAFFRRPANQTSLALVAVADGMVGDGLAAAAHAASGHICGAVTPVALTGLQAAVETLIPALYPEAAPLEAVSNLQAQVDQSRLAANVRVLEALGTRFHSSDSGMATTAKVRELFEDATAIARPKPVFTEVDHLES